MIKLRAGSDAESEAEERATVKIKGSLRRKDSTLRECSEYSVEVYFKADIGYRTSGRKFCLKYRA